MRASRIYEASSPRSALRQGEILSNVAEFRLAPDSVGKPLDADRQLQVREHPYAVVLTQDCDLDRDWSTRQAGVQDAPAILPSILLAEVVTADVLRPRNQLKGDLWNRVKTNKDERYQFLEAVPADCDLFGAGLPELGVDFKRYFTLPSDEIYRRVELDEVRRHCRLASPYLEHLSTRFCYYQFRIALPEPHKSL